MLLWVTQGKLFRGGGGPDWIILEHCRKGKILWVLLTVNIFLWQCYFHCMIHVLNDFAFFATLLVEMLRGGKSLKHSLSSSWIYHVLILHWKSPSCTSFGICSVPGYKQDHILADIFQEQWVGEKEQTLEEVIWSCSPTVIYIAPTCKHRSKNVHMALPTLHS